MSLVSSTSLLQEARAKHYAIGAFNVHTLEMLQAVVEAAEEAQSPLIIQSTVGTVKHLGAIISLLPPGWRRTAPACPSHFIWSHCNEFSVIISCIRAGYTSVMIDASHSPFEENVAMTQKVVEAANAVGINVEAELGKVGGVEDDIVVDERDALLADPKECAEFVERTGVHTLAPAIGTAHGIYKGTPNIDFDRIGRIAEAVDVPLVLHGGSGIPEEQVKRAVSLGMAKMNVATELRILFSDAIKHVFAENPDENDPRKYMVPAKKALKAAVIEKMQLCGCAGRAGDF
ncbi:ketose-bisphosphate aldolase [Paenibacillus sp. AR247]|uniref:class II fructose-bisphosphate aldolase n=1 Tax=Paenibacillus sp. AR247 TaxID=1631599 RepID=UPI000CF9E388|nr:ketose-bisphosphate aldolase [Paenibacillus sp. AR247]PQP91344.1 tagatose-bisphosphate aldolase [Paenibacillus sp. AR247]